MPSKIGRSSAAGVGQLERPGGHLAAQAGDTLAAQLVDAGVESPAPLRDGILLILRLADQAVEIVVAQGGKVGNRIHGLRAFRRE